MGKLSWDKVLTLDFAIMSSVPRWERKDRRYWVELQSEGSSLSQGERAQDGEYLRLRSQASRHLDPGLLAS